VENSFQLDEPLIRFYECLTPRHLEILENVALPSIIEALNAGNLAGAIEMTNCKKASENNITKCILINVDTQIDKINHEVEIKTAKLNEVNTTIKQYAAYVKKITDKMSDLKDQLTIQSIQLVNSDEYDELEADLETNREILGKFRGQKQNLLQSLKNHNANLKTLTNKRDLIKERISNTHEKDCPICFQYVTKPMVTPCCKNVFCFECLATSMAYKSACPFCRTAIKFNDCCLIDGEDDEMDDNVEIADMPIPKLRKLMKLLEEKKDKRILLFSGFDNTFKTLEKEFEKNNYKYEYLKGNTGHIKNIIEQYNSKKFNILILNAKFFGSGLNLQMTDDIIIYHRMDKDLEKQIIGRGQRLGRTSRLNVHYLCYSTELPTK
jgi:SNF2 family DNA or RNA helicase